MAVGDVTLTKVGVFYDTTIAAGCTGQNLGNLLISGGELIFVSLNNGQVLVLKKVVAGW